MNRVAGADAEPTLRPGETLASFRLVARVATGRVSEVWLAKIMGAEGFEKIIALKTMRAEAARSPEAVRLFIGEAAIAAQLYHPNIVQLVDCGHVSDHYYMAMEFVNGMTLGQMAVRLKELGRSIPPRLLVHIGLEACAALHYAHDLEHSDGTPGFLHRDLEPQNVMITRAGAVKIIDFGAARPTGSPAAPCAFSGHRRHAALEVLRGHVGDRRSDIYSLGTILHDLTGGSPALGSSLRLVSRIVDGQIRAGSAPTSDLPEPLLAIIRTAMSPRPEDRFPTAEHMARALQTFVAGVPVPADRAQSIDGVLRSLFHDLATSPGPEVVPTPAPPRPSPPAPPMERFAPETAVDDDEETRPLTVQWSSTDAPTFAADELVIEAEAEAAPATTPDATRWQPPDWLFERRGPESVAPDVFASGGPGPAQPAVARSPSPAGPPAGGLFGPTPATAPTHAGPDFFAVRRGGTADAVALWARPDVGLSAAPVPEAPPPARTLPEEPSTEAARCFDRGLAFVSERQYTLALDEWQRADALDPGNRLYETNLRRLRAQIDARNAATTRRTDEHEERADQ